MASALLFVWPCGYSLQAFFMFYPACSVKRILSSIVITFGKREPDDLPLFGLWHVNCLSRFVCTSSTCHWWAMFCDCGFSWASSIPLLGRLFTIQSMQTPNGGGRVVRRCRVSCVTGASS